jgi:hypothetical protein
LYRVTMGVTCSFHKVWVRLVETTFFEQSIIKEMAITLGIMTDVNAVFTCCINSSEDQDKTY